LLQRSQVNNPLEPDKTTRTSSSLYTSFLFTDLPPSHDNFGRLCEITIQAPRQLIRLYLQQPSNTLALPTVRLNISQSTTTPFKAHTLVSRPLLHQLRISIPLIILPSSIIRVLQDTYRQQSPLKQNDARLLQTHSVGLIRLPASWNFGCPRCSGILTVSHCWR
jgi:hypothetical protein